MRRRAAQRRRLRNFIIILLMLAAFCSGFFGHILLSAHAEEPATEPKNRYYTSVQLKKGDSLWDIAREYYSESDYSLTEYVDELKRMNGLTGDRIHSGEYITVVYFQ